MKFYKKKVISREDGKPYLVRRNLFECPLFSIKLHHIMLSDHDCLHDHPWSFISIMLRGSYTEYSASMKDVNTVHDLRTYKAYRPLRPTRVVRYSAPAILWRPAKYAHKLMLDEGKTVWTLVITFKKVRQWGFFTLKNWVPWFNYVPTNTCE